MPVYLYEHEGEQFLLTLYTIRNPRPEDIAPGLKGPLDIRRPEHQEYFLNFDKYPSAHMGKKCPRTDEEVVALLLNPQQ